MSNNDIESVPHVPPVEDSNVVSMPTDRSGSSGTSRQQMRQSARQLEKDQHAAIQKQKELQKALESPITKREFQRAMFNVFGSLEKVVAEFRKMAVRQESTQAILYSKGVITKEEYEEVAALHVEWNAKIDSIITSYDSSPINEVVRAVSDWNTQHETMKIEWQHIDLAPRLLADEQMTLEEKLAIAADMDMPGLFIEELRRISTDTPSEEESSNEFAASFNVAGDPAVPVEVPPGDFEGGPVVPPTEPPVESPVVEGTSDTSPSTIVP